VFGCLLVVGVGLLFSLVVPIGYDLLKNAQISGRTSPGLLDLVAALATGAAGAVGLARRDVAAVLPGVAIAISLVPPLVVAGVCLGRADLWQAAGALVLFLSNLLALVFAGMVVFAASGYGRPREQRNRQAARRANLALGLLFTAVFVPLVVNTAATVLITVWTNRVEDAADRWLSEQPDASVTGVHLASRTMRVEVLVEGEAGAAEVQQRHGQAVTDDVVHVTGNPVPFVVAGPLRELFVSYAGAAPDSRSLRRVLMTRRSPHDFLRHSISRSQFWTINRLAFRGGSHFPTFPDGPHTGLVKPFWIIHDVGGMDSGVWY
jgi:uncharacterized membrane protein